MDDAALRKRLGARLLVERIQVKDWNESEAARAAGIAPKTIRRIERGENYEMESLGKYASALGRSLVEWLAEVIREEVAPPQGERFPERRAVNAGPPAGTPERRR